MLNNVRLKKVMKQTIFRGISLINNVIPKNDNKILLYSGNLGIRHNLLSLKEALLAENYDKKYQIICGVESKRYFGNEKALTYVGKISAVYHFLTTKHVFYTTGQIPIKPSKKQVVIHMNHGTSDLKTMGKLSKIDNGDEFYFTYMLAPSDLYVPIVAKEYDCPIENVKVCGEPMTDDLFKPHEKYEFGNYDKVILWMPTFRQSDYLNYDDSHENLLPMFEEKDYNSLNNVLSELNFKLIVKLHTAQNTAGLEKRHYSNLDILTNADFISKGYEIYKLMPQVDAFIGDYSSASLQFLLVNKPNFFVVPDMEEYGKNRGFCFDNPEEYMAGPIIKTQEELYKELKKLKLGIDDYKDKRAKVINKIFKYQDGENTRRVLELSNIKLGNIK